MPIAQKNEASGEGVDVEAPTAPRARTRAVGDGERELEVARRPGFLHVGR
jgi:hypothetical protein